MLSYILELSTLQRGIIGFIFASVLLILVGKIFIKFVKNFTQPIREYGMETHLAKKNTPTFGGVLMIFIFVITSVLFVRFNMLVAEVLISAIGFGVLGFVDDFLKLKNKNSNGLSGKFRLIVGFVLGFIVAFLSIHSYGTTYGTTVYFPFVKAFYINIHILIYIWVALVIVGTANSVNLTDGLDGLATTVVSIILFTFLIIIMLLNLHLISNQSMTSVVSTTINFNEIFVIIAILLGVMVGFLWFNAPVAKIFMGDSGSLFLGGALGSIAIAIKYELILLISGIILVLESVSVILQIYYYKLTKKRIFLMAPLHHHFEKKGLNETNVMFRFLIVTIIMSAVAILLIV